MDKLDIDGHAVELDFDPELGTWHFHVPGLRITGGGRDRAGREWTATAAAYEDGRDWKVVLRSGDLVRIESHWRADGYEVVG